MSKDALNIENVSGRGGKASNRQMNWSAARWDAAPSIFKRCHSFRKSSVWRSGCGSQTRAPACRRRR